MEKQVEDGTMHPDQLLAQEELASEHQTTQPGVSSCIMSVRNEQFVEMSKTHSGAIKERAVTSPTRYQVGRPCPAIGELVPNTVHRWKTLCHL